MANTIQMTILQEGTRHMWVHYYLESDGNEGELYNRVIFDPMDVPPSQGGIGPNIPFYAQNDQLGNLEKPRMSIIKIVYQTAWFDMKLGWDGTTPFWALVASRDTDKNFDFSDFGGIKDYVADNPTGKLLLTTSNFAPLGSAGFFVVQLRKD